MKSRANEWIDQFPEFHELPATEQIVRLVFFHTIEEQRETISQQELKLLFDFIGVPIPDNLPQFLAHLCRKQGRLIKKGDEYSLRREVERAIREELAKLAGSHPILHMAPIPAFEFPGRTFKDTKIQVLLGEAQKCYATECWNACGILMRIVLERTLDAADPRVKSTPGLKGKLNVGISTVGVFSQTIVDTLKDLRSAKLVGDIVAHHSTIVVDKPDIDLVTPSLRMLIKEVTIV